MNKEVKGIFILFLSLMILSCSSEEIIDNNEDALALKILKPELLKFIDFNSKKVYNSDNGEVVYYQIKNEKNSYVFRDYNGDYSEIEIVDNSKVLYSGISNDIKLNFDMATNKKYETKMVNLEYTLNTYFTNEVSKKSNSSCEGWYAAELTLCLVEAALIASSDGPLPIMDAVAVTVGVACGLKAAKDFGNCLNNES
jgi:hypothetical protein